MVALTASPIKGTDESVERWALAIRDNTERRSLERQILAVQERERERMARDMHDTVVQQLNTLALYVGTVRRELADAGTADEEQLQGLDEAIEQARNAADQARSLSHAMGSVELSADGLAAAIRRLAGRTELAYGIEVAVEAADVRLPGDTALQAFRIAGEALGNAVRHGRPTRVAITLIEREGRVRLTVADDGSGVSEDLGGGDGIGLSSMRYRAGFINGTLDVRRGDGAGDRPGTVVACDFPIA